VSTTAALFRRVVDFALACSRKQDRNFARNHKDRYRQHRSISKQRTECLPAEDQQRNCACNHNTDPSVSRCCAIRWSLGKNLDASKPTTKRNVDRLDRDTASCAFIEK